MKSKDSWASRGYCRRFIWNYADVTCPLDQLIKKDTPWRWGDEEKNAFDRIKAALTSYPVLRTHDFSAEFIVHTDSSGFGEGAICQMQRPIPQGGFKRPSTGERKAEENYPRRLGQEDKENN